MATVIKLQEEERYLFFSSLFNSTRVATAPGAVIASNLYVVAKVSQHVASQAGHFPLAHGTIVTPPSLFPSALVRQTVSSRAGILAAAKG